MAKLTVERVVLVEREDVVEAGERHAGKKLTLARRANGGAVGGEVLLGLGVDVVGARGRRCRARARRSCRAPSIADCTADGASGIAPDAARRGSTSERSPDLEVVAEKIAPAGADSDRQYLHRTTIRANDGRARHVDGAAEFAGANRRASGSGQGIASVTVVGEHGAIIALQLSTVPQRRRTTTFAGCRRGPRLRRTVARASTASGRRRSFRQRHLRDRTRRGAHAVERDAQARRRGSAARLDEDAQDGVAVVAAGGGKSGERDGNDPHVDT